MSRASRNSILALVVLCLCGHAVASSTASIAVGGSEQQISGNWDQGAITIAFNGFTESVHYGQFSSPASIASAFAAMFSQDYLPAGLCANAAGAVITFKLRGSSQFGALDVTGSSASFQLTSSGFTSQISQIADTGTVTLTTNGVLAASTTYGAGATPSTIAAGLSTGVAGGSFVNITASGDELNLVAKQSGAGTNYSYSLQSTSYDSTDFNQPSFLFPTVRGSLEGGANAGSDSGQTVYSYIASYDPTGNVSIFSDSVMGNAGFGYDTLNRLVSAWYENPSPGTRLFTCWSYDSFGNRTAQLYEGPAGCPTLPSVPSPTAAYNTSNQVTWVQNVAPAGFQYDDAGNVTQDNLNRYLYDAEGRICAVASTPVPGMTVYTGYLYDADGARVAKGSIATWSCDPSVNGFQVTGDYVLGPEGEQATELAMDPDTGTMSWQHTNIWAGGTLIGTYEIAPNNLSTLHFYLYDPLGSRRVQTDFAGVFEQGCSNLPFGDSETCAPTPTEHLFTGKERDTESGNDYFGARYYASTMGRWLSPDRLNLTEDRVLNPANTLNKYVYGGNNPFKYIDPDGKDITIFYENSFLSPPGHIMFVAENQRTGDAAAMSWGPVHDSEYGFTPLGSPVNSTATFGFSQTTDELKAQYSSLTIQTSPEDAQEVINFIRQLSTSTNPYTLYGPNATNCTTVCRNALKAIGILPKGNNSWTPAGLWGNLFSRYSPSYWQNPFAEFLPARGTDYGNRPSNYDPFDLMSLLMGGSNDNSSVTTTQTNTYIDCSKQDNQSACQ